MMLKVLFFGALICAISQTSGFLVDEAKQSVLEKIATSLNSFLCHLLNIINLREENSNPNDLVDPILSIVDLIVKFLSHGVCPNDCCQKNLESLTQSADALHNVNPVTFTEIDKILYSLLRYLLCLLKFFFGLGC